ncbi:MAG: GNAT family N-acetyltransferase [Desulfovibrio sp.]
MDISRYTQRHEQDVIEAISKDPDWEILTNETTLVHYRKLLATSATYVCYENNAFCGYVRAILDTGVAVYVSELYVLERWRNLNIGQSLLQRVKDDHSNLHVYAFSDEDAYYIKKGFTKIGSIFEL